MKNRSLWTSSVLLCLLAAGVLPAVLAADDDPGGIRSLESIVQTMPAPALPERAPRQSVPRVWPHQPPVVPHDIRDYQVDRRHNRCLDCHQGPGSQLTGAKVVPASHYVNREAEAMDRLAGARYFCTFCHVPQQAPPLLTDSRFGEAPATQENDE